MENPLEMAWKGPQVAWHSMSGNHQSRAKSVSQVDELRYGSQLLALQGEGSAKEQWPLPALIWEKAAPPAPTLMLDNSLPPRMSLMPFQLLPQHWSSKAVCPSKSVCGPLGGAARDSLSLHLPQLQSLGFLFQTLWGLSSWHWNPWMGVLVIKVMKTN